MKKNGPWIIKNSKIVYESKHHLQVMEDEVIQPKGKEGTYTTLNIWDGVYVLPIDEFGDVYLIQEFKYPLGKEILSTVGGYVEKGEEPLEAAKRELREEAGIVATEFIDLGFINPAPSSTAAKSYLYLARKLSFTETEHEPTEVIRQKKLKFDEAVERVIKSEITHASAAALILKANEYINNIGESVFK